MTRPSQTADPIKWLRLNGHNIAPLTGTDTRALRAIAASWELFSVERAPRVLDAIAILAATMQRHTRPLGRELAAMAMDWEDRDRYWPTVEAEIERVLTSPLSLHQEAVADTEH